MIIIEICPICNNQIILINKNINIAYCDECKFAWQYLIDKKMKQVYNDDYFDIRYRKYLQEYELNKLRLKEIIKNILNPIGVIDRKGIRILDIGFGIGSFLKLCDIAGIKTYGYDVKENNNKITKRVDNFQNEYDIVTLFDSIEHLELDELNKIMNIRTSYLVISTPELSQEVTKIENWRHYRPNEHLFYFNFASLGLLLQKYGFEIIHSNYLEDLYRLPPNGFNKNILTIYAKKLI